MPEGEKGRDCLGWIRSQHYHCKDCGQELQFWGRIQWSVESGVIAIGACPICKLLMVEFENVTFETNTPIWWININTLKPCPKQP